MKKIRAAIYLFLLSLIVSGCGYVPTAKLSKNILGDKIYTKVIMSREDPQNTVLIKDAITSALVDRFGTKLVKKNEADSFLVAELLQTNFTPLAYDENGYVISYRTTITLRMSYTFADGRAGVLHSKGEYDFPITADSVISDSKRFEAIKFASEDAIDEFTAVVAIKALQDEKR